MQLSTRFAAVAVALAAVVPQVQATTQDLKTLTSAETKFGNTFSSTGSFTDYYTFTIGNPGAVSGATSDTSYVFKTSKNVVLNSLVLTTNGGSTVVGKDTSASSFTFSGLSAGSYSLAVNGYVYKDFLSYTTGSYSGSISAESSAVASSAPEPADLALTLVGLAGVGMLVRRRAAR